jgi:hypothetical protein
LWPKTTQKVVDQKWHLGYNSYTLAKQEHHVDYLIKMEMARANIIHAIVELAEVEGMEYMVEQLREMKSELNEEIAEYKQHSDLD